MPNTLFTIGKLKMKRKKNKLFMSPDIWNKLKVKRNAPIIALNNSVIVAAQKWHENTWDNNIRSSRGEWHEITAPIMKGRGQNVTIATGNTVISEKVTEGTWLIKRTYQ